MDRVEETTDCPGLPPTMIPHDKVVMSTVSES